MKVNLTGIGIAALAMTLAACSNEMEQPADSSPDAPAGISVSDGRMNMPAVSGNPASVYFTLTNDGDGDQTLRAAHVAGAANAMFHRMVEQDGMMRMEPVSALAVAADDSLIFSPGGLHVMAMNLDGTLAVGGETEVTLTFESGDKVSFPVSLLSPGQDYTEE